MTKPKEKAAKNLASFRAEYDKATIVPKKIKAGLLSLGQAGWEYEVLFARACGISLADLGAFRDQFSKNVVQLPGGRRAWAGTAALATRMRSML